MTKIYLGSDHAGLQLKNLIYKTLVIDNPWPELGALDVIDLGPSNSESVDYPDFADLVCKNMKGLALVSDSSSLKEFGILVCGSGQGMSMRANKYSHIRAALVYSEEVARMSREHNNANVLCLGERLIDPALALKCLHTFLLTKFLGERHQKRVLKLALPC